MKNWYCYWSIIKEISIYFPCSIAIDLSLNRIILKLQISDQLHQQSQREIYKTETLQNSETGSVKFE